VHLSFKFRPAYLRPVALESVIKNSAAIYFDFNEPVITNQVFHTVNRNFIKIANDIRELPKGIYFYKVEVEGLGMYSGKVILQ